MIKNLRSLRISKGITQQQLADVIGTSQQSINKYENHNVEPDVCTLAKLADYFETTIDFLVGHIPCSADRKSTKDLELSKEEYALVQNYRRLSREERDSIRLIVKIYLKYKTPLES